MTAAAHAVLTDDGYTRTAARVATEIRALPPVDAAADVLRRLARGLN